MISVIASIHVKPEMLADFLTIFKANVANVRAEKGCIEYFPALDLESGLPPQRLDAHVVTVIEKWEDLAALKAHISAPHMLAYKEKTKHMVTDLTLKVLEPV